MLVFEIIKITPSLIWGVIAVPIMMLSFFVDFYVALICLLNKKGILNAKCLICKQKMYLEPVAECMYSDYCPNCEKWKHKGEMVSYKPHW